MEVRGFILVSTVDFGRTLLMWLRGGPMLLWYPFQHCNESVIMSTLLDPTAFVLLVIITQEKEGIIPSISNEWPPVPPPSLSMMGCLGDHPCASRWCFCPMHVGSLWLIPLKLWLTSFASFDVLDLLFYNAPWRRTLIGMVETRWDFCMHSLTVF